MSPIILKRTNLHFEQMYIRYNLFSYSHHFNVNNGRTNDCFAFILKGNVNYRLEGRSVFIPEGSLYYLPTGLRYAAVWEGNPEIEFYSMGCITPLAEQGKKKAYDLQVIEPLSTPEIACCFKAMYDYLSTEQKTDQFRAVSLFYDFYAQVWPYLREKQPPVLSPVVQKALKYIEDHLTEDFLISDLARACSISEAQLYHLFQQELHITPSHARNDMRIKKASIDLEDRSRSIDDIAAANGFHSTTYFRKVFRSMTDLTPTDYRKALQKERE